MKPRSRIVVRPWGRLDHEGAVVVERKERKSRRTYEGNRAVPYAEDGAVLAAAASNSSVVAIASGFLSFISSGAVIVMSDLR